MSLINDKSRQLVNLSYHSYTVLSSSMVVLTNLNAAQRLASLFGEEKIGT